MRAAIDAEHDEHGRLILGDPRKGCPWCGAPAVATIGHGRDNRTERVAWWHPPTNCCQARRHSDTMARRAAVTDQRHEAAA